MKIQMRVGIVAASLMLGLMAMLLVWQKTPAILAQQSTAPHGQTATKLPDGRWLLLGGEGTEDVAAIIDPRLQTSTPLATGWVPRTGHTATLLANGQVLIVGGRSRSGQLIGAADLVDPETRTILQIAVDGGTARTGHTTTLLTDGRVLVAGGTTNNENSAADLEIWDVQEVGVTTVNGAQSRLINARNAHTATLLANGHVLLTGGVGSDGTRVSQAEIYDPLSGQVIVEPPSEADPTPVHVTAAIPDNGAQSIPVDARLALRLSTPLQMETVNANTVSLTGPDGLVQIAIVPAEGGRLVFVSPRASLSHDSTYTLNIIGAADSIGVPLVTSPITFVTAEKNADDADNLAAVDAEAWIPDGESAKNGWRSQRPDSPWRTLPPLEGPPGVTALAGQVLRLDGRPLQEVTLEIEGRATQTDGTGRFLLLLEGIPTSEQELVIDARTASRPDRTYGLFETRAKIRAGVTTALPFTIWSPQLDTANQVTIPYPMRAETVITTPLIPGLELHLPAGTAIYDHDGQLARTISITPIPVDRPPFPMPVDADFPVFFTIQPGGAYIHSYGPSKGAWLVYPNARESREDKRVQFFHYDPDGNGWYVYGMGTVKGTKVVPDARTRIYEFTGASFNDGQAPPPAGPPPGDCCAMGGDPVSLATGIFTFSATDLYIPDVLPIAVTRGYNSRDPEVRPFGRGMTHAYAIFQHSANQLEEADLYLPDGGKIHYVRIPDGGLPWYNAVLEHTATPTAFYKSRVKLVQEAGGERFHLTLKDGTVYVFGHGAPLQAIRDRYGNEIRLSWSLVNGFGAGTGNITRITSPNGRWIEFTYYAGTPRVHQAKDNIGRTVTYVYDANGNLTSVTDPMNHVTSYTYDAANRMTGIKPPNLQSTPLNLVTNEYTTAADAPTPVGWVKQQTHADGGIEQFNYTVVNGKSISTDVTDSLGHVRRVSFNSAGYLLEDIRALGEAAEQKTVSGRQAGGNFVTSSSNPLLNQEAIQTYNSLGNLTSVTRIAGTLKAVTTYTYEPLFNQVATITDPLDHTTTYGYDASGNVTSVTDPLNHTTTMTYNGAGQLASVTDPLQHTTTYSYQSGELTKVRSHLGFEATRFVDAVGRTMSATDPLGRITRYEYDLIGRLSRTTYPNGGDRSFTYYPEGQVQTVTDARNNITTYGYDPMGRLASRTDPLLQTESFTYDLDGSPIEHADRKGQVTSRSYDELRRLSEVQYADGSTVAYTYDNANRVTTVADSVSGNIVRAYDDLGRTTSETTSQGEVTYTYDLADRRTTMTITGQPTISYGYDDANRLTSVTQDTRVAAIAYDDANRRSTLTLPNGVVVTYGYDTDSRLTSLQYANSSGTLGNLTYTYDSGGNVIETGGTFARTGLPAALGLAIYDSANRLTSQDGVLFSHDANGNLTSAGVGSRFWNARNQLIGSTGSIGISFEYDGIGRRVGKTVAGASKAFLHDGSEVVQELASGLPVAHYMTGLGFDEWFTRIDSAGTTVPLVDQVGSPISLTNSVSALTTQYTYEPFGLSLQTGPGDGNPYRFTGREDDGSGAMYYRARYYDAAAGRFLTEDPMDSDPLNNLYTYVSNNPLIYTDPLGLQSWPTNNTAVPHRFGEPRAPLPPHDGADITNRLGQPVYSTVCGNVIEVSVSPRGGNQIRVLGRDGSVWGYAHTRPTVAVGDCVRECQVIGHSDGSGGVTPHLHLSFRPTRLAPRENPIPRLDRTRMCQGAC